MACNITVGLPISGTEDAQGIVSITVTGHVTGTADATECSSVEVWINQTTPVDMTTPHIVVPVVNTEWTATFTASSGDFSPGDFVCGNLNKYAVMVRCVDAACPPERADSRWINCGDCPTVVLTITPDEGCTGAWRKVRLDAEVVGGTDTSTYAWGFGVDDAFGHELTQAGDGGNPLNTLLPPADANGVRVVPPVDYPYGGVDPTDILVSFWVTTGLNPPCPTQQSFHFVPCRCDPPVTVTLELKKTDGSPATPTSDGCYPAGDYKIEVTGPPTVDDNEYTWILDNTTDNSQHGRIYEPLTLDAGDSVSVTVSVSVDGCEGGGSLPTLVGCGPAEPEPDCTGFDAELQIFDSNGNRVTDDRCHPPGQYTVRSTGSGASFKWWIDDVEQGGTASELPITIAEGDDKIVRLEATTGECRDGASKTMVACEPEPPPQDPPSNEFGCGILRLVIALLVAATAVTTIGAICFGWPWFLPGIFAFILLVMLALWIWLCHPEECEIWLILWQSAFVATMALLYIAVCLSMHGCPWLGWASVGVAALITGGFFLVWLFRCKPSSCRISLEVLGVIIDAGAIVGLITLGSEYVSDVFTFLKVLDVDTLEMVSCLQAWVPAALAIGAAFMSLVSALACADQTESRR